MSQSSAERTEPASPRKRKQARERGEVRKSTELNISVLIVIMFAVLGALWDYISGRCIALFDAYLSPDWLNVTEVTADGLSHLFFATLMRIVLIVAPLMLVAVIAGVAINIAQVGFLFTTKPLAPKFSRINPMSGFKRLFSARSLVELVKSLAKVAVIVIICTIRAVPFVRRIPAFLEAAPLQVLDEAARFAFSMGLQIGMAMLVVGVADFAYQWWKHEKDLRMTKQEVKDEYKQTEGNPQIKNRIKQKQRQMAMMRMMQQVPDADVVITNPTHYAVALRYDESTGAAPVVLAKGVDHVAMRIKEVAAEHRVELVENRPLAQALYASCDVGDMIPEALYQAVAEVLAYVYRLNEGRGVNA